MSAKPLEEKLKKLAARNPRYVAIVGDMVDYLLEAKQGPFNYAPCAFITEGEFRTVTTVTASLRALAETLSDHNNEESNDLAALVKLIADRLTDLDAGEIHGRLLNHLELKTQDRGVA